MNTIHPFWYVFASLGLALLPLFFAFVSSYLKVSIIFGLLRSGLGAQQIPGGLVIMALSLAITLAVMAPTLEESSKHLAAINFDQFEKKPSFKNVDFEQVSKVLEPWVVFMKAHAGEREIMVFRSVAERDKVEDEQPQVSEREVEATVAGEEEVSFLILLPAYLLSELKEAFAMGFVLLLPFVAIDLIVANILVGLGMFMVSPVIIALPLKLLVFLVADGWLLLTKSIVQSYVLAGG